MKIARFVEADLEYFRKNCNFVNYEITMFEMRAKGHTIAEIAEVLEVSVEYAYKISQRVNDKIIRVL